MSNNMDLNIAMESEGSAHGETITPLLLKPGYPQILTKKKFKRKMSKISGATNGASTAKQELRSKRDSIELMNKRRKSNESI